MVSEDAAGECSAHFAAAHGNFFDLAGFLPAVENEQGADHEGDEDYAAEGYAGYCCRREFILGLDPLELVAWG